jgi:hypothetical protein
LKNAFAIVVFVVALTGAAFLGVSHLKLHGQYHCFPGPVPGSCDLRYSYWTVGRAWWQIPAAIVVALVGLAAAALIKRR